MLNTTYVYKSHHPHLSLGRVRIVNGKSDASENEL